MKHILHRSLGWLALAVTLLAPVAAGAAERDRRLAPAAVHKRVLILKSAPATHPQKVPILKPAPATALVGLRRSFPPAPGTTLVPLKQLLLPSGEVMLVSPNTDTLSRRVSAELRALVPARLQRGAAPGHAR